MGLTGGNDWDDDFEDYDSAGDSGGDQYDETGSNADDKYDAEAAIDEPWDPINTNNAFDAFTISLSKQVKVPRKTWAAGRKQRALAWESSRPANVLNVMEANWPSFKAVERHTTSATLSDWVLES
ncbi:hypothetical protein HDU80_009644 [Chytriomyces hyalinus]|nr:hypothetical protein HDU80_009644 [Chytriomyces hyalinus]